MDNKIYFFIRYSFQRETVYIYSMQVSIAIQKLCSFNSPCFWIKIHLRCPHWVAPLQTFFPFTKWATYFMIKSCIFVCLFIFSSFSLVDVKDVLLSPFDTVGKLKLQLSNKWQKQFFKYWRADLSTELNNFLRKAHLTSKWHNDCEYSWWEIQKRYILYLCTCTFTSWIIITSIIRVSLKCFSQFVIHEICSIQ